MKTAGLAIRCSFCSMFLILAGFMVCGIFSLVANIVSLLFLFLFLLLAAATLFFPRFLSFLRRLWKHIGGKIAIIVVSVISAVFIICAAAFSVLICSTMSDNARSDAPLIVILGCQVNGTTPGIHLTQRLDAALSYLDTNTTANIIVTGGQGRGEDIPEAEAMKNYLVSHGIDASRIYTECDSHSTRENMLMAKYVSDENNLGNKAVIITHEFHQYRAKLTAEYYGFETTHYSAKTSAMTLPSFFVREWAAVGNDLCAVKLGFSLSD